jgi:signal transduction histidine kinase
MDRSDREDELEDALTDQGIEEPWLYTSPLTDAGLVASELDGIPAEHAAEIISVLAAEADVYGLVAEVDEGSKRLSELVGALKSYSFLDQAPVQEVNVVKGIDDTLLILKSKTKSIAIDREYAPDLPLITAYGSQLNQVWTNLIDNASDSLRDAETPDPKITIKAFEREGCIIVTINDNGPGIPPAVRERIFEAFYTTKEPGKGTGLGLDTVYSIVVKQHRGAVEVESEPGSTTFEVKIPLDLETAVV